MRRIAICVAALLLIFTSGSVFAASEPVKIGTISFQEIIDGSQVGKDARKVLEAKQSELQLSLKTEQEETEKLKQEIEKKRSVWSDEVRGTKEREYQKRMEGFPGKVRDAEFEFDQLEKKALAPIFKEMQTAIKDLGERMGLSLIIETSKSGVVYANESLNISADVAKELDARMAKK